MTKTRRAQLAASVPVAELRAALEAYFDADVAPSRFVRIVTDLIEAAEQRAGKAEP